MELLGQSAHPFVFLMTNTKLSSKTLVLFLWQFLLTSTSCCCRMNQAPTVGFEQDVGSRTTHHFMYPESAKNLPANVSFVLVPFKALDLLWIASALSTGQIRL